MQARKKNMERMAEVVPQSDEQSLRKRAGNCLVDVIANRRAS